MKVDQYKGQRALVIGLGVSGQSAAFFLFQQGARVHGIDSNPRLIEENPTIKALKAAGMTTELDHEFIDLTLFDFIVVSPGIPQSHALYRRARELNVETMGEIELGCRSVCNPLVGITGTNGKTTVTHLVTHVLNLTGRKAKALGNVGVPFTKELLSTTPDEILVLELSSYQLETLSQRVLETAVILNITPDHLDRHVSMEEYAKAKCKIQACLKEEKILYIERQTALNYGHLLQDERVKTYGQTQDCFISSSPNGLLVNGKPTIDFSSLPDQPVSHDLENIMAAYALCRHLGVDSDSFIVALSTFKKPPHRIEFILEKNGVSYYDDSKGTNIDAVCRAVQSLKGEIILIAGGMDKGAAYTPWLEAFTNKVKYICAIGQAADKIQKQLSHRIPVQLFEDLERAVEYAAKIAQSGDNVLLSPGCSSWDMFKDYVQRGKEFQRVVCQL